MRSILCMCVRMHVRTCELHIDAIARTRLRLRWRPPATRERIEDGGAQERGQEVVVALSEEDAHLTVPRHQQIQRCVLSMYTCKLCKVRKRCAWLKTTTNPNRLALLSESEVPPVDPAHHKLSPQSWYGVWELKGARGGVPGWSQHPLLLFPPALGGKVFALYA